MEITLPQGSGYFIIVLGISIIFICYGLLSGIALLFAVLLGLFLVFAGLQRVITLENNEDSRKTIDTVGKTMEIKDKLNDPTDRKKLDLAMEKLMESIDRKFPNTYLTKTNHLSGKGIPQPIIDERKKSVNYDKD